MFRGREPLSGLTARHSIETENAFSQPVYAVRDNSESVVISGANPNRGRQSVLCRSGMITNAEVNRKLVEMHRQRIARELNNAILHSEMFFQKPFEMVGKKAHLESRPQHNAWVARRRLTQSATE